MGTLAGDNRSDKQLNALGRQRAESIKSLCPILFSIGLVLIPEKPVYNAALSGARVYNVAHRMGLHIPF